MRKIIISSAIVLTLAILLAYFYWPRPVEESSYRPETESSEYERAKELLEKTNAPSAALNIILKHDKELQKKTEMGSKWRDIYIKANTEKKNVTPLIYLYQYFPESFKNNENAALLIGNALILSGNTKDFDVVRKQWEDDAQSSWQWKLLDADKLILQGKKQEASDYLKTQKFDGKVDVNRFIKLALLNVYDHPGEAWDYLNQAYQIDPTNPLVHSYRGKLLEVVGKDSQALNEYIIALQLNPKNILAIDQLGEFYIRQGEYQKALKIWETGLAPPSRDFLWLKTIFWGKVTTPLKFDWKKESAPDGLLKPLITYYLDLKPDQFWDAAAFARLPSTAMYLNNVQSIFWLRLLQALKDDKEEAALNLIKYNPLANISWDSDLEKGLTNIINYRQSLNLTKEKEENIPPEFVDKKPSTSLESPEGHPSLSFRHPHPFFKQLENLQSETMPEDIKALLSSKEAFSALFLAANWYEAALQLENLSEVPEDFPAWYAYGLTEAIRTNRGNDQALEFAAKQKPTPELNTLIGEILITSGKLDAGLQKLEPIAKENSPIGARAALLSSLAYLDQGNYNRAKEIVISNPAIENDVKGQEILARISLKQQDDEQAERIYRSIIEQSTEAKSYFARKAYLNKDYSTAKKLTESLLQTDPANPILRDNYEKIVQEEKGNQNSQNNLKNE